MHDGQLNARQVESAGNLKSAQAKPDIEPKEDIDKINNQALIDGEPADGPLAAKFRARRLGPHPDRAFLA